jgi:hypothetical protein
MSSPQSIYAAPVRASGRKSRDARCAQQQRAEARRTAALQGGPARRLDRLGPLLALLRRYRESGPDPLPGSPLATFVRELGAEVDGLEAWVRAQPRAQQRAGAVIRQALDFLRDFGRLTVLDFSSVPEEDRPHLVTLLALEHRWCYAAAGTTREAFKLATGRTGAR